MPKVSQIYGPRPAFAGEGTTANLKSILPPGGNPLIDRDFMAWIDRTCERANQRWLDSFRNGVFPDHDLIPTWQLINHLYKWVIGWPFPDGEGPSRAHRIRFLASYYSVRPTMFRVEAARYIDELAGEKPDGGG